METLDKMKSRDIEVVPTKITATSLMKQVGSAIMSDTPRWAKIVRLVSFGLIAVGSTLAASNPVTLPLLAAIIPYGGYISLVGTASATFVQFFSKKE